MANAKHITERADRVHRLTFLMTIWFGDLDAMLYMIHHSARGREGERGGRKGNREDQEGSTRQEEENRKKKKKTGQTPFGFRLLYALAQESMATEGMIHSAPKREAHGGRRTKHTHTHAEGPSHRVCAEASASSFAVSRRFRGREEAWSFPASKGKARCHYRHHCHHHRQPAVTDAPRPAAASPW